VASEGTVAVVGAPTNAVEWGGGARARIRIEAAFPTSSAKSLECEDVAGAEGSGTATCRCEGRMAFSSNVTLVPTRIAVRTSPQGTWCASS